MNFFPFIIESAMIVMSFKAGKFLNELIYVQLNPPTIPNTILSYKKELASSLSSGMAWQERCPKISSSILAFPPGWLKRLQNKGTTNSLIDK